MKQTIAIINECATINVNDTEHGFGGSETWVIEIAKQFANHDFNVMIFSPNSQWIVGDNKQYIPLQLLDYILSYTNVSYFFIPRYFSSNTLNIISKYSLNKNLYIVAHDTVITLDGISITQQMIDSNKVLSEHLQKIIVMSDFGAEILNQTLNINSDYFLVTGNGINSDFIKVTNEKRDNNLFWSSRWERGLELIVNEIIPRLKPYFPDIKVHVAQYEDVLPEHLKTNENVVYLGSLNKEQLYNEMQKHKVMFYPNFYPETFCITILEAILCNMELLTVNQYGPKTTLQLFNHLMLNIDTDYTDTNILDNIAENIKTKINNYYTSDRVAIREIMRKYISNEYSWESIYDKFNKAIFHKYE